MKRSVAAAAAIVCLAGAASAGDPFAATYGNTVTQVFANGQKAIVYVNADRTWERHVGQAVIKGTYEWKDATHACFTVTDPAPQDPAKATSCNEFKDEHHLGDSWTEQLPDGSAMTVSITAGR